MERLQKSAKNVKHLRISLCQPPNVCYAMAIDRVMAPCRKYNICSMEKLVRVLVFRDEDGFWIEVPEMPGCAAKAPTLAQAMAAIEDEINTSDFKPLFCDRSVRH